MNEAAYVRGRVHLIGTEGLDHQNADFCSGPSCLEPTIAH